MAVRVKICGITREADVDSAVSMGADAVGFISGFPASPRNISLERAGELASRVPPFVSAVLVTTGETIQRSESDVRKTGIGTIQLYGDAVDPGAVRTSLGVRLIRPYLVKSEGTRPAKAESNGFDALLTDTYRAGRQGGTGIISDWDFCRRIREEILPVRMILSGGLRPENVAEGIRAVRPFAVDVSSGVESSPGVKDPDKIAEFIRRAREANLQ
ncbi:MAG: phosphoribosylanthranilate isomerase [Thaumarchaeota archaeon]|nr:phosphoribosylanthranilate isomerase [Nitrososphaerota archaeon]